MAYFNSYFYGVVTFFAISGFLISRSIEKSTSFASFMKKRLLRLYPGLWCAFIISFVVIVILYNPRLTLQRIFVLFGTQLTIFQVYTPEWLRGYGNGTPNGALWTIVTEIQLYIVTWLLYKKLKKLSNKQWYVVIAISTAMNVGCWAIQDVVPHVIYRLIFISFVPHLYIYLIGVFLYFKRNTILSRLSMRWKSVLILYTVWMTISYFCIPKIGFYAPISIGLTLPVMIITVAYGLGKHRLKYDISYGMYLYHFIVINALIQLGITNGIMAAAIVLPMAVLMGFLQSKLIDKPLSKYK